MSLEPFTINNRLIHDELFDYLLKVLAFDWLIQGSFSRRNKDITKNKRVFFIFGFIIALDALTVLFKELLFHILNGY